jgi:hypothetical protein
VARIRAIKPAFFRSVSVTNLPIPTRLTWAGLWTYLDDHGRGRDDARLIKAEIWPLDEGYTARKVEADLGLIAGEDMICRYQVEERRYLHAPKWKTHQRVNRPQSSLIPPCPIHDNAVNDIDECNADSRNDHGTISDRSGEIEGGSGSGSGSGSGIPSSPLAADPSAPSAGNGKPKPDRITQQSEKPNPPPPAAVPLIERWLTVVEHPERPMQQADAQRVIVHLLDHIDPNVLDEIIGRCAAEAETGTPPGRAKYLVVAARRWAAANQILIPDIA